MHRITHLAQSEHYKENIFHIVYHPAFCLLPPPTFPSNRIQLELGLRLLALADGVFVPDYVFLPLFYDSNLHMCIRMCVQCIVGTCSEYDYVCEQDANQFYKIIFPIQLIIIKFLEFQWERWVHSLLLFYIWMRLYPTHLLTVQYIYITYEVTAQTFYYCISSINRDWVWLLYWLSGWIFMHILSVVWNLMNLILSPSFHISQWIP